MKQVFHDFSDLAALKKEMAAKESLPKVEIAASPKTKPQVTDSEPRIIPVYISEAPTQKGLVEPIRTRPLLPKGKSCVAEPQKEEKILRPVYVDGRIIRDQEIAKTVNSTSQISSRVTPEVKKPAALKVEMPKKVKKPVPAPFRPKREAVQSMILMGERFSSDMNDAQIASTILKIKDWQEHQSKLFSRVNSFYGLSMGEKVREAIMIIAGPDAFNFKPQKVEAPKKLWEGNNKPMFSINLTSPAAPAKPIELEKFPSWMPNYKGMPPERWEVKVGGYSYHRYGRNFECSCCHRKFGPGQGYKMEMNEEIIFCSECRAKIFPKSNRGYLKIIHTNMGHKR